MSEQKYAESRPEALHPEEPFFFLRAQDVLAPHALMSYASLLRAAAAGHAEGARAMSGDAGAEPFEPIMRWTQRLYEQAEEVEHRAAQMVAWQAEHHVKLPD